MLSNGLTITRSRRSWLRVEPAPLPRVVGPLGPCGQSRGADPPAIPVPASPSPCNRPCHPYNTPIDRGLEPCGKIDGIVSGGRRVKFNLIDKIEHLDDQKIIACKSVAMSEEYLADHFPTFPVLPGVMMLEALTQAATWLMHHRTKFARTMSILKEARNIRYGTFVAPGHELRVEVEFVKETETGAIFKATSSVDGNAAISGRIELAYFDLTQKDPGLADLDAKIRITNQERWNLLRLHSPVNI